MLSCFPRLYTDELFYSACARYNAIVGPYTLARYTEMLFGSRYIKHDLCLPSHLRFFVNNLPRGHKLTVDRLIDEHTLLPYFGAFEVGRLQLIRSVMSSSARTATQVRFFYFSTNNDVLSEKLRYCPICAEEDRRNMGECYWRRLHQISEVLVCPEHKVYLRESPVATSTKEHPCEYVDAESVIPRSGAALGAEQDPHFPVLYAFARDASWILSSMPGSTYWADFRHAVAVLLWKLGLVASSGILLAEDFADLFKNKFSSDLLYRLGYKSDGDVTSPWIAELTSLFGPQTTSQGLILLQALGVSAEEFFRLEYQPPSLKPFGDGPWPCLNFACRKFGHLTINACYVTHEMGVIGPIGVFKCECGFAYRRVGVDQHPWDAYTYTSVKEYGETWPLQLRDWLQDPSIIYDEAHHEVKIALHGRILESHLLGIDLTAHEKLIKELHERSKALPIGPRLHGFEEDGNKEGFRSAWLHLLQTNPDYSFAIMRSELPLVSYWLLRNDFPWLAKHWPSAPVREAWSKYLALSQEPEERIYVLVAPGWYGNSATTHESEQSMRQTDDENAFSDEPISRAATVIGEVQYSLSNTPVCILQKYRRYD